MTTSARVLPLGIVKAMALLGCVTWTAWQDPAVPWWCVGVAGMVAGVLVFASQRARALEVQQRLSFERVLQ